ncbi:MAG: fumarylacetoacetate hydrolase family protein [Rhodospirillaceae bacterium]|nr:fumarylacetoacetate hydrolase family protein [Rhodospirillaceae bacterium]
MKLATLKEGGRDGTLIVVSQDLTRAVRVRSLYPTLQSALDDWDTAVSALREVYGRLSNGTAPGVFTLDTRALAAPLPRAYHWVDGSAYLVHVELVRKARGAEVPESFYTDPLVYQGGSDDFVGPCDPIVATSEDMGIDLEAEVAVMTGDVPMGTTLEEAGKHIKLVMLVNDVTLRNLIPNELAKGFGFYQSKPATAFSPVAVTPDELGKAWDGGKVSLPLVSHVRGKPFGHPNAGIDLTFDFRQLIMHAARTRRLGAGTIIGSGTVANRNQSEVGSSCLAERRTVETLRDGKPSTPFLRFGDQVRIEMFDEAGASIFGAIDQIVTPASSVRHAEAV